MSDFRPGDRVNITIEGARIDEVTKSTIHVVMPNGTTATVELSNYDGVTVERIAPAEWPPRAGDLWRDRHGELWFIHENPSVMDPRAELMGRTTGGARWTDDASRLLDDNAPLTLVHREGEL